MQEIQDIIVIAFGVIMIVCQHIINVNSVIVNVLFVNLIQIGVIVF